MEPATPAPPVPSRFGPRIARPLSPPASPRSAEGPGARDPTAHLPGPRPRPRRRQQHRGQRRLTCRAAPLRSASLQRRSCRYPTSIFSRFKGKSDQLFCSRSGSAAPSSAAARGLGGLSSPASSRAPLRPLRPSAPPAAARSARLPAPPATARRAPFPDVTGRSRAPPPPLVDERAPRPAPAYRPPPPRASGASLGARAPAATICTARGTSRKSARYSRAGVLALLGAPWHLPFGTWGTAGEAAINSLPLLSAPSHYVLSTLLTSSPCLLFPNFVSPILSRLHFQALLGQCITLMRSCSFCFLNSCSDLSLFLPSS